MSAACSWDLSHVMVSRTFGRRAVSGSFSTSCTGTRAARPFNRMRTRFRGSFNQTCSDGSVASAQSGSARNSAADTVSPVARTPKRFVPSITTGRPAWISSGLRRPVINQTFDSCPRPSLCSHSGQSRGFIRTNRANLSTGALFTTANVNWFDAIRAFQTASLLLPISCLKRPYR